MCEESERNVVMRKRDHAKNRRDVMKALSLIMQIGLSMMVCMGISLLIGYGLVRLCGTKIWIVIMMFIGIFASLRSMLILTGQSVPGHPAANAGDDKKENDDESSQD